MLRNRNLKHEVSKSTVPKRFSRSTQPGKLEGSPPECVVLREPMGMLAYFALCRPRILVRKCIRNHPSNTVHTGWAVRGLHEAAAYKGGKIQDA